MLRDIVNKIKEEILKEATGESGARGSYVGPFQPGVKEFNKNVLGPFNIPVSKYNDAMLEYDSYDGKMDEPKKQIKKIESKAKKESDYLKKHPNLTSSDDDGNNINQTPGKGLQMVPIKESGTSISAGPYNGPMEIGLKKWKKEHLGPFQEFVDTDFNHKKKQKTLKNNINTVVGVWEKNADGTYDTDEHDVHTVNEWIEVTDDLIVEDLGVWFGTKKKPKGSSQPKGPWVNICKKVDGHHPPCGRPEASDKSYPKCRAAGVAGKMTDSEKRSACSQKRKAEKTHSKSGTGNSPKMVSYKPREKQNESLKDLIKNELRRLI